GRNRSETENLIGIFVNTLVLRTKLAGNPSFSELLAQIRETTLGAYSHQDIPFEKLVEELQPERDLSRNPLFQVMLMLQNMPPRPQQLGEATATLFPTDPEISKFDLTLAATETPSGLRLNFEYSTELFEPATIDRLI